ncbi:ATP-dependent helicase HrpB, partial [Micrococcus luteus]
RARLADAAVGYAVRGDAAGGGASAVEFVTPGLLLRRLLADPGLDGVGAVVLDEVHERDLDTDVLFALLTDLRQLRPELALVAMSATVDAAALAARWARGMGEEAPLPVVSTPAVLHPLREEHAPFRGHRLTAEGRVDRAFLDHVADTAARAHAEALDADPTVDALVFLPGVAEVEAVAGRLAALAPDTEVRVLHGRQEPADQDAALAGRADPAVPRVVVATAVAESSLTVPGVRLVIDSGLAREPRRDRGRGMAGLVTVQASRAAAGQRAGRAARLGPGTVVRCHTATALAT